MTASIVRTTDTASALLTRMADAMSVSNGTFCIDPRTGEDVTDGYTVAVHTDREQWLRGKVTSEDMSAYVFAHADLLWRNGLRVAGWRHPWSGVVYLYIARVVSDRDAALRMARKGGHYVYTNLRTGQPIRTGI